MAIKSTKKEESTDKITLIAEIVKRLAYSDTSLGISELGREYSKNKIYIIRLLSSLESIGWVSQDQVSRRYKVGDELVTIGVLLASRFYLPKIALPYLYELADYADETTAICIRVGYERLFIHDSHQTVTLGQHYPLWLGATGMAMVAFLDDNEIDEVVNIMRRDRPAFRGGFTSNIDQYRKDLKEIKERGYAMSVSAYVPDICVLAAPIFSKNKTVIGSLVIRGKSPHFNLERAKKYSTVTIEMANNITRGIQDLA
jgi:IclR family KDG regulon transcriptional repressor